MNNCTQNLKQCCGTCVWHRKEDVDDGWICTNDESYYLADWTNKEDSCENWEKRGWTKES